MRDDGLEIWFNGDVVTARTQIGTSGVTYSDFAAGDFDGDGLRNIWTNETDAIGSVANYLSENGWRASGGITVPAKARATETVTVDVVLFTIRQGRLSVLLVERDDTPFWRTVRDMDIPDTLATRMALFRESGTVYQAPDDLFRVASWAYVMVGQGLEPENFHHMGGLLGDERLRRALESLKGNITNAVNSMPSHEAFLKQYCV